jgi:transcription elongation factor GreA
MVEKIPMTPGGLKTLEDELRQLKNFERRAVIRAIAEAREHGDLSENAEYHAARERQSFIEGRITELEDITSRAQVIDISQLSGDTVRFGATVTLADDDSDDESVYQIVGVHEADIRSGRLSIHSPLARALIGKQIGDSVEVTTPGGSKSYEIVGVRFN